MVKIMVVDDELEIIYSVKEMLTREGFNIVEVCVGMETLAKIKKDLPDLVLHDVTMPDLNGWEIPKSFKDDMETKDTMVVMLTT
jgi:two-component system alkaline phosphatase synthesis response regulator PhoP